MNQRRVLVADDHAMFLEVVKKLLEPVCQIVGAVSDGHALISEAKELRPDLIIADINMPNLNGLEACEQIIQLMPESRIIILTACEDSDMAEEAIRRGALGYVLKQAGATELIEAIEKVSRG